MRIWFNNILKRELGLVIDWSQVEKEDYLLAMEGSPIKDLVIKVLPKEGLTDKINDPEIYVKGIEASNYYEEYDLYKMENIINES